MGEDDHPCTQNGHQRKCQLIVPAPGHDQEDRGAGSGCARSDRQTVQLMDDLKNQTALRVRWKNAPGKDMRRIPLCLNGRQDLELKRATEQGGEFPPVGVRTVGVIDQKPVIALRLQVPLAAPSLALSIDSAGLPCLTWPP